MRTLAVVAIIIIVGLLGLLLLRTHTGSAAPLPTTPVQSASADRGESPTAANDHVELAPEVQPASRETASEPPKPALESEGCIVRGRVVDELSRPLAGVHLRLAGFKEWARGIEVPRLAGRFDMHGFEIESDTSGAFRFAVPLPTVERVSLEVASDDFHDSLRLAFGGRDALARPPLHSGENDLGTLRLGFTGAIRGRITDEAGNPIENARLTVGPTRTQTIDREAWSDAAGNFSVGHVPEGTQGLNASCTGWLSEFRTPIEVARGQASGPVDFVLRSAPVLAGVVVDEQGHGLAAARLRCWPASSGAGAFSTSSADGGFVIPLPQDEPYTLEVKLDGYETFGLADRTTRYAPNTRDLRIVLKGTGDSKTRFVVVDAVSGTRIERFGLDVHADSGSGSKRSGFTRFNPRPPASDHTAGEVEVSARPGLDSFNVSAPGYLPLQGDVAHDSKDSPVQTLRLDRGSRLVGRVVDGKQPAADVSVSLERGRMVSPHQDETGPSTVPAFRSDGDDVQKTTTDAKGEFDLEGVGFGTYRLALSAPSGASLIVVPVNAPSKGEQDLGTLELQLGASIHGQVLVPAGRSRAGLTVALDGLRSGARQLCDSEGRFLFSGLAAGTHSVMLEAVPGQIVEGASVEAKVAAGETREVVLDARDRGTCKVTLAIECAGEKLDGLDVWLRIGSKSQMRSLGTTDVHGRVSGWMYAAGEAGVELGFPDGAHFVHPSAVVPLALDADVEMTVHFEFGSIRFEIPAGMQLPEAGAAMLEFPRSTTSAPTPSALYGRIGTELGADRGLTLEPDGRHFVARRFLPGEYDGSFRIQPDGAPGVARELYRKSLRFAVRSGERSQIQLP